MERRGQNGLTGVLSLTASALFVKILGFLYKIPLSHVLSDEGMGYYNSALNVYALFFIVCSCAIPKSLSVLLSRARLYQTKKAYKKTFIFLALLVCSFGLFMSLILLYYAGKIAQLLGVADAAMALLFIAPAVVLSTLSSVCRGYLLSYDKVSCVGVSECIEAISKLFGGIAFVYLGTRAQLSLPIKSALAVLGITIGTLLSFLYLLLAAIYLKKEKIVFCGVGIFSAKETFISFLKISLPLMLGGLIFSLSSLLDVRLICDGLTASGVMKQDAVRIYGNYSTLVLPLISFVNSIVSAFCLALFPRLCSFFQHKNECDFIKTLRSASFVLLCCSLALSVGFYFFGEDYFILLFKDESVDMGTRALKIISVCIVFVCLLNLFNTALEARGKSAAPLITLGLGMLIKIPVAIIMIPRFGIMGAAYSTVVSYLVAFVISFLLLRSEIHGFMPNFQEVLSCIFCSAFSFSVGVLLKNVLLKLNVTNVFRLFPLCLTATLLVVFVLFISKNMSKSIRMLSQYTK